MAYIGKSPTGTGVRQRYYFTATGGETTLGASADDNGLTLSYSDGAYVDVLLNGIELVAGTDYNTNTANRISGLSALAASDVVAVTVYDIFTVADTVSAKDGGTFSGNVGLAGNDLILDTDADSKIEASTDDTINIISGGTTGLTVDSSGRVLLPQVPCCHVRLTTSNSQDTSNPYTTTGANIKFDSIQLNQGSCYSASTGAFTCPVAGVYAADFQVLSHAGTTSDHEIALLHNSTTIHRGYNSVDNEHVLLRAHALINCAVNDTISGQLNAGQIYIDIGGDYSSFTVRLVG